MSCRTASKGAALVAGLFPIVSEGLQSVAHETLNPPASAGGVFSLAKLYSNENFPLPVVEELRRLGHDVVTIQERGRAGEAASDPDVLAWSVSEQRAVLTLNRKDFMRLHREQPNHAGIIVCTVDPDFLRQASRIHAEVTRLTDLAGQLLRVNRPAN